MLPDLSLLCALLRTLPGAVSCRAFIKAPARAPLLALLPALLMALLVAQPLTASARGYTPQKNCGDYAGLNIKSPAGTCVALVADEAQGLRMPRRILEVAPGRYWIIDMGSWEPNHGRLLEMSLPADGPAPRRARITVLADKLDRPLGLAVGPQGDVYIGEAGKIWHTPVPAAGGELQRTVLIEQLPSDGAHPLKELAFGSGGRLYVNMGSATDACRDNAQNQAIPCPEQTGKLPRAAVYLAMLAGPQWALKSFEPFATGLRNSVALAVLPGGPAKGMLLQGENSIDYADAAEPPEELNLLRAGGHYGWPYCVGQQQPARGYENRYDCRTSTAPLMRWPAHAAPLQLLAGPAGSPFANQLLVVWHGWRPGGHRVVAYSLNAKGLPGGKPVEWLAGWEAQPGVRPLGKPTGVAVDSQGRLLVVEDLNRTVLMLLPAASPVPAATPAPTSPQPSPAGQAR